MCQGVMGATPSYNTLGNPRFLFGQSVELLCGQLQIRVVLPGGANRKNPGHASLQGARAKNVEWLQIAERLQAIWMPQKAALPGGDVQIGRVHPAVFATRCTRTAVAERALETGRRAASTTTTLRIANLHLCVSVRRAIG